VTKKEIPHYVRNGGKKGMISEDNWSREKLERSNRNSKIQNNFEEINEGGFRMAGIPK